MITITKEIEIKRKPSDSGYVAMNADKIEQRRARLGATIGATRKMMSYKKLCQTLMPPLVGSTPSSPDWQAKLNAYFDSISISINEGGKKFNVGFTYDDKAAYDAYKDKIAKLEKHYLETCAKDKGNMKIEADAFKSKYQKLVDIEAAKIEYGTPDNEHDYIIYIYSLLHREVANRIADVELSHIRFFVVDEEEVNKQEVRELEIIMKAEEMFASLYKKPELMDTLLILSEAEKEDGIPASHILKLNDVKKITMARDLRDNKPARFISILQDDNIMDKGFIERCLDLSILNRITNTTIIRDRNDDVVGHNMEEAIINLRRNSALKTTLEAQYNAQNEIDEPKKETIVDSEVEDKKDNKKEPKK